MQARKLIDSASYGPEALQALGEAYDAAWQEIAGNFGDEPREIELARARLANALLSVACEDSRDVKVLKHGALQAMARVYRERTALRCFGLPIRYHRPVHAGRCRAGSTESEACG